MGKVTGFYFCQNRKIYAEKELDELINNEYDQNFKKKYSELFDISDELDINYKFYTSSLEDVLNIKGQVKIDNSLYQFTDKEYIILDGDYKKLENIGTSLKSGNISDSSTIVFDPYQHNQLKSYDQTILGSGFAYNDAQDRRLSYHVEKIVYSSFAGMTSSGTYYFKEGYELILVLRQNKKNWLGNWKTMSANYAFDDGYLYWRPHTSLTGITNTYPYFEYSTSQQVKRYYVDYETTSYGVTYNPYFYVYEFNVRFWSSGIGEENAVTLNLTYF
ncbi:MAG: hypothetical protein JXP36_01525 [Bacteroidales bacterium]|nr:hypothetical protein [Bacteroidales bacterium]